MLSKRNAIAIAAIAVLVVTQAPARSNPAAALPACATGVGCVLLGTVMIGGVMYYIWRNQHTGERYQVPAGASAIIDQENPRGWWPGERVPVADRQACAVIARRYRKRLIVILEDQTGGVLRYICIFAPAENPLEDW